LEDREPVVFERDWPTDVRGGMELLLDLQRMGHEMVGLDSMLASSVDLLTPSLAILRQASLWPLVIHASRERPGNLAEGC